MYESFVEVNKQKISRRCERYYCSGLPVLSGAVLCWFHDGQCFAILVLLFDQLLINEDRIIPISCIIGTPTSTAHLYEGLLDVGVLELVLTTG